MKKKHLLMYLPAGGGHISAAKAIVKYFQKYYNEYIDAEAVDGFAGANRVLKKIIIDGYKTSQTTGQWVFEFLYRCNKLRFFAKITQVLMSWFLESDMKKILLHHKPTHITILHFFFMRPMVKALKSLGWTIPVTTIITDPFTVNRLRSLDKKMHYIVFSKEAKNTLLERNVPEENIQLTPIVLDEKYIHPASKDKIQELKNKFGLVSDKKTILILGGGDGIPKGAETLQAFIDAKIDAQIMVVCGRSGPLFRKVTKIQSEHPEYTIKIFSGFIDFIYDVINVADIIITKGGPATIMEILMMNKIPFINSYIREQEKGNVQFVLDNNLGIYEPDVAKMVDMVKKTLKSEHTMEKYHRNIQHMYFQNGTQEVVKYLLQRK